MPCAASHLASEARGPVCATALERCPFPRRLTAGLADPDRRVRVRPVPLPPEVDRLPVGSRAILMAGYTRRIDAPMGRRGGGGIRESARALIGGFWFTRPSLRGTFPSQRRGS